MLSKKTHNFYTWSAQNNINPINIVDVQGIYIYDDQGNQYIDLSSQLVNVNIGHKHPKMIKAIHEQVKKIPYTAPFYQNETRDKAADLIIEKAPDNFTKVMFTNGGAEANEHAIRFARQYTKRKKILSGYYGYHGSTYGASSLSGDPRRFYTEASPAPGFIKFLNPYLYRSSFSCKTEVEATTLYLNLLEEKIIMENPEDIAAIWFEGIVGSNGVIIPPKGYFEGVRKLCDQYGILMVIDDVMVGFGRIGAWFSCERFNYQHDIITFAKGVTSGYIAFGGVLLDEKIADYFGDTVAMTGLTYSGHPMGCAAAIKNIEIMEEQHLIEHAKALEPLMKEHLKALYQNHPSIGDVRSMGVFGIIEFVKDRKTKERLVPYGKDPEGIMKKIKAELFTNGLASFGRENYITIAPPLTVTDAELLDIYKRLDKVCAFADQIVKDIT